MHTDFEISGIDATTGLRQLVPLPELTVIGDTGAARNFAVPPRASSTVRARKSSPKFADSKNPTPAEVKAWVKTHEDHPLTIGDVDGLMKSIADCLHDFVALRDSRIAALEKQVATLEWKLTLAASTSPSVAAAAAAMPPPMPVGVARKEDLDRLAAILMKPVVPVRGKSGVIIGAQRVDSIDRKE